MMRRHYRKLKFICGFGSFCFRASVISRAKENIIHRQTATRASDAVVNGWRIPLPPECVHSMDMPSRTDGDGHVDVDFNNKLL